MQVKVASDILVLLYVSLIIAIYYTYMHCLLGYRLYRPGMCYVLLMHIILSMYNIYIISIDDTMKVHVISIYYIIDV